MFIAEQAGQPLSALAGLFRMAHAFIDLQRLDQAEAVARSGIRALEGQASTPTARSVLGALHLVLAVTYGREGQRAQAHQAIDSARHLAAENAVDRNDFGTEFGPTNVELHAVSVAVDLGDAGQAMDTARTIDAGNLSHERQCRLWMDVARAQAQMRHNGEALSALLTAEELAPSRYTTTPKLGPLYGSLSPSQAGSHPRI